MTRFWYHAIFALIIINIFSFVLCLHEFDTYYRRNQNNAIQSANKNIEVTDKNCGGSGNLIYIGYPKELTVCYDRQKTSPLFVQHTLKYSDNNKVTATSRLKFKTDGLPLTLSKTIDDSYKQTEQIKTLANLLNSTNLAKKYINKKFYLAKGHLAPDADEHTKNGKDLTYYYINTIPQWQNINNGNWKSLEMSIRSRSLNLKKDLQIITGTFGDLRLEDRDGRLVEINLSNYKLPVPKYVWKIVYTSAPKLGIAFVNVNNPFSRSNENNYICKDICDETGWGTKKWKIAESGLLYCCTVEDLKKAVNTVPHIKLAGILNHTNNLDDNGKRQKSNYGDDYSYSDCIEN